MAIENLELVSGITYRVTKLEELNKEKLLVIRAEKVTDVAAHQKRIDTVTEEIADIDAKLSLLLKK